jgi:hypothetical protein
VSRVALVKAVVNEVPPILEQHLRAISSAGYTMDPYPKPVRGRGRGRARDGGRGRGAQRGGPGRARATEELASNHARYDGDNSDGGDSSSDGVDFESAAATRIQANALDGDRVVDGEDARVLQELAADFTNLSGVFASVPFWVRLGGGKEVGEVLCGKDEANEMGAFLRSDESSAFDGVAGHLDNVQVASEVGLPAAIAADNDNADDFDAWLDQN